MSISSSVRSQENKAGSPESRVLELNRAMAGVDLFTGAQRPVQAGQHSPFRLSPDPFYLEPADVETIAGLGPVFHAFYQAANRLYQRSVRGTVPAFLHEYLDQGKPEQVLEYNRMNRFKHQLPQVIRPDIIFTEDGPAITELDSVPGGMGTLAFMMQQYAKMGFSLIGGADGMIRHYAAMLRSLQPQIADPFVAIVVSDESEDYRGEMTWLAQSLRRTGLRVRVCHPKELSFRADGLYLPMEEATSVDNGAWTKVDVIYRFFELFDLKNIPQIDLILYAVRKEMVAITPPLKSQLEEKSLFALFHHPALAAVWQSELPKPVWEALAQVLPYTWLLDPRPLPPHAIIPDLSMQGLPVTDYRQLTKATQRERELVIKPSGFSPEAWGSRGVTIGHDVPADEWAAKVESALQAFSHTPYVLQEFHKARKDSISYYDFTAGQIRHMHGRARLCPYYFVIGDQVELAGILATVVPLNKKAIHGMVDAVMAPVATKPV